MWLKIKNFYSMKPELRRYMLEALFYLAWARILKALPFSKVAPSLGTQMEESTMEASRDHLLVMKRVHRAVATVSRHTPWESKCLVRAIAAMKMLERRGIDSTLYMGTGKDSDGKMIAHAWLRSGPIYITGAEEMNNFVVLGKFAKKVMTQDTNQRSTSHG